MKGIRYGPTNYPIIGTKWVFRNKMDELGNLVRNKRLICVRTIAYHQSAGQSYNWNRRLFLQSNKEFSFRQGCRPNQNFSISHKNEEDGIILLR